MLLYAAYTAVLGRFAEPVVIQMPEASMSIDILTGYTNTS